MNTYPDNEKFHSPSRVQYFTKVMPVTHRPTTRTGVTKLETQTFHCAKNTWLWNETSQINTKLRDDKSHNNVISVAMSVRRPNMTVLFVFVNAFLTKYYTAKIVRMIVSSLKRCGGKDLESHTRPHPG